jgi:hypothetical protein
MTAWMKVKGIQELHQGTPCAFDDLYRFGQRIGSALFNRGKEKQDEERGRTRSTLQVRLRRHHPVPCLHQDRSAVDVSSGTLVTSEDRGGVGEDTAEDALQVASGRKRR